MRILLVSNYQPPHMGGIEFAAGSLKRCWEEAGHAVTWLTTDLPRGARPSAPDNLRVPALNFLETRWQINSPLPCPAAWPTIARAIRGHDVVNVHSLAPGLSTMTMGLALRRRHPVVTTQHVGIIPLKIRGLGRLQELFICRAARWGLRQGMRLTFVGCAVREWFIEHAGLPGDRLVMTPAGIDPHDFFFVPEAERQALRAKWRLAGTRLQVLFVGRFYEKKGLPLLRDIAAGCPEADFTLVGQGPLDPNGWGLPNVRVLAFVTTPELRELYGSHDVFIMPSFGEGWPAVVPQAMACGLECLISEETFAGYDVDRERFLVRPRDAAAMAAALREVDATRAGREPARAARAAYAAGTWNWQRTAALYLQLFADAIAARRPPAPTAGGT